MINLYKGAVLIDGLGREPLEDSVLAVENDTIVFSGKSSSYDAPAGANTINLSGKTVIPGLIDCHIHMDLHGMADTSDENHVEEKLRSIRTAYNMKKTLQQGITTVRNAGSVNHIDFAVKSAVEAGWFAGPRIFTSGQILSMTAQGNDYFKGMYREADGPDEVRKAAREQLKAGADFLKVMATGAYMNPGGVPGAVQYGLDELEVIVDEANKLGLRVAAHAHGAQGIVNAALAGVKTIEHGSFIDERGIELMLEKNIYLVPTFVAGYHIFKNAKESGVPDFMIKKNRGMRKVRAESIKRAIKAGIKVAFGSDAGTSYNCHGLNAMELILWVKEGFMTPLQALCSGTRIAAEAIGIEDRVGTLEKGKLADFVVVEGDLTTTLDPLIDRIKAVYKEGKEVSMLN
ncbi:MAG: amidohydrolase family protein [Bacillota bacterium]|nr:amidohydrolase family protein [Bacillota bacterium]MDW7728948.1 amidohydrolase family protein [Bacillota bacterium]